MNKNKLGEIADLASGGTPSRKHAEYWNGDIPWVTTAEVAKSNFIYEAKEKITEEGLKNSSAKLFDENTILLAMYGQGKTRGRVSMLKVRAATNQACLSIKPKENIDGGYLYFYLEKSYEKLRNMANSGGQDNLSMALVKELEITYPILSTQQKISSFFQTLDKKIQLQQQKIDLLQEQKKGFLQKIFHKEVCFNKYNNIWSQKKLEDVAEFFDNLRVPITSTDRIKGLTPYYGANGIQDYVEGYTHKGEFVLIAEDGANDVFDYPVNYVNGEMWVNNHAHVVKGKAGELDNLFLAYRIKAMNIYPWLVGGSRAKLNGEILKKIPILLPSYSEQQRIGKFFAILDKKIQLQKEKLELLQKQKQGFMQQMFI